MAHLEIRNKATVFSQSSETFGVSREMWPTLERLIQDAESLKLQTNKIIDLLIDCLKKNQNQKIAKAFHEKLVQKSEFYALACGDWIDSSNPQQECCELFWTSIRAALSDQFGGFVIPDDKIRRKIETKVVEKIDTVPQEPVAELEPHFWLLPKPTEELQLGRIWLLVAYANILAPETELPKTKSSGAEVPKPEQNNIEQNIEQKKIQALDAALNRKFLGIKEKLRTQCPEDKDICDLKDWHHWNEGLFKKVRYYAVWRLLRRYRPSLFLPEEAKDFKVPDDDGLVQRFSLLLSRGAGSAPSVEISFLLRVLVGRYLNYSPAQLEWAKDRLRDGVRYILRNQNEIDGSWAMPTLAASAKPLLHRYSPLLHLLDLDTDLLRPEGTSLVDACARALAAIRRALLVLKAEYEENLDSANDFQNPKDDFLRDLELDRLVDSVVVGLSLGATISDRLKDLLSDSILRHRGAVDGETELELEDIPNSLKFRDNIKHGVIASWAEGNIRRPGAILIYGPPGTGKTTVAKIIAAELNKRLVNKRVGPIGTDRWRFLTLSPADFTREGADRIVACAEQLFNELRNVRRCVVLLDEMEEFLRARGPGSDRDSRLITTAFLPLLQEAVESREIILVVATNFVGNIDAAVTRQGRFDLILPLGPPDDVARKKILESIKPEYDEVTKSLANSTALNTDAFNNAIAEYTMGYAVTELKSFFLQLWENIKGDVRSGKLPQVLSNVRQLKVELWRMRADYVPMALSGRAGSDWKAFEDETKRYRRYASNQEPPKDDAQKYWREPMLPL